MSGDSGVRGQGSGVRGNLERSVADLFLKKEKRKNQEKNMEDG